MGEIKEENKMVKEFHEDGLIAVVEILEDNSNDIYEKYKIKFMEIKKESPFFINPDIGEVIDIEKMKGVSCPGLWYLNKINN
ncbi:MAG: hypothetical protein PVH88_01925 [Ignavibacteria bacterium]|jgi:hypothetical protein